MYRTCSLLFALLFALALCGPAQAGGWAVVTLDSGGALDPASPDGAVQPGVAFAIGFMVLQHGDKPMPDLSPTLAFANAASGEALSFVARADGPVGHYVATVTLPAAGVWNWQIDAFGPVATMAPLTVAAAPAAVSEPVRAQPAPAVPPLLVGGALLFVLGLGAAIVAARRQQRAAVQS